MLRKILAVLAMATAMVLATATAASAAQSSCLSGRFCVWKNGNWNYSPDYYWTIPSGSGGFCVNYGSGLNDKVMSSKITGGRSSTQYRDANCSGTAISFIQPDSYGGPSADRCNDNWTWACVFEGAGEYLPSSAWILK